MRKARKELGDDARLVSARRISAADQPPVYEVHVIAATSSAAESPAGLDTLRREIETLRETVSTLGSGSASPVGEPAPPVGDPALDRWTELLRRRGVSLSRAGQIAARALQRASHGGEAQPLPILRDVVAEALADSGAATDPVGTGSTIVVGPSGAGKTTVLAKIAAECAARGDRPVLVAADGESVAGEDVLEAIAAALELPFETAFLDGQLASVVEKTGPATVYLVDAPGRTPFERDGLTMLRPLVEAVPGIEVLPVIPATADVEEARLLFEGYAQLGAERAVLTKLDELARPGRLVDLAASLGHPIAWVTYGRAARGTSSSPADPRVVDRILGTALTVETSA